MRAGNEVVLHHFVAKTFRLNPRRKYQLKSGPCKPDGLWLSDETDYGWKDWCKENNFRVHRVKKKISFRCDTKTWLVIRNRKELLKFEKEFLYSPIKDFPDYKDIDYAKLKKRYGGILISPYQYRYRLKSSSGWYYTWDCASACVWDLSTIKRIPLRK